MVKRVRKLLTLIDKRAMGKVDLLSGKGTDRQRLSQLAKQDKDPEEVTLKATNKAIERALGLALFFQGQEDCRVRLKTGSVGVIDDIVVDEKPVAERNGEEDGNDDAEMSCSRNRKAKVDAEEDDQELPETQIRQVSVIEVGISLR